MAWAPTNPSQPIKSYYRGDREVDEECHLSSLHYDLDSKGVATITMNRPDKLNSLSRNMIFEHYLVIEHCKRDANVKALLWTGAGRAFSSGADFVDQSLAHAEDICTGYEKFGKGYMQTEKSRAPNDMALKGLVLAMLSLEKPSVCAVNGITVGGTVNMALLLHDFVIASEEAKFKYPFTSLGLTPEVSSSSILPALVGMPTAKKWIMLGDWFSAHEAKDAGLILSVEPAAEMLPKARSLAERLAASSATIGLQKRAMHGNCYSRISEAMDHENIVIGEAANSPEFFKAMSGFNKKFSKKPMASFNDDASKKPEAKL